MEVGFLGGRTNLGKAYGAYMPKDKQQGEVVRRSDSVSVFLLRKVQFGAMEKRWTG